MLDKLHLYFENAACNLGHQLRYECHYTIPSVCPTINPETFNYISTGDSSSSCFRQEHQSLSPTCTCEFRKPYIALSSETYISLRQQELRSYKRIDYEFYCKELFVAKHKTSYSCESAIYFNLSKDIIKNNCNFDLYFNKTDVTPTVLDRGNKIVLAN